MWIRTLVVGNMTKNMGKGYHIILCQYLLSFKQYALEKYNLKATTITHLITNNDLNFIVCQHGICRVSPE